MNRSTPFLVVLALIVAPALWAASAGLDGTIWTVKVVPAADALAARMWRSWTGLRLSLGP